jgi:hypothetical protein
MQMTSETMTPRVYEDPHLHVTTIEQGTTFENGYRVTVSWSEEDQSWIATADGMRAFSPGLAIGLHPTSQLLALCELACALAATVDCFGSVLDKVTDEDAGPAS